MSLKGLVIENKKVYQEIDLEEVLGVDLTGYDSLKNAIGQRIVDYMRDRTAKSLDNKNKQFKSYKSSYKKSDVFEAYGKTSKVDMELTGSMLSSMGFKKDGNVLRFGFDDQEDEEKAYGHMTGMEGHKFLEGKTKIRQFFGISEEDLRNEILPDFESDLRIINAQTPSEIEALDIFNFNSIAQRPQNNNLNNFLRDLFDDEEF